MQCPRCNSGQISEIDNKCPECGFSLIGGSKRRVEVSSEVEKSIRRAFRPEFRIEGLLGRGGMSLVYLAHEVELNRFVALKVLPLELALGTESAERFKREAKIAASLDHPHIVPIHQIGSRSTFLWFTMKFVRGHSLAELIADRGPLDLVECLRLVEQVASALHYAHDRGVVHRDVKAANVMIDENGWAVVCDFGVAKAFGSVQLTQTGGTMGTPSHMSPEQLYGQPLTGRSDQYSMAIMTYECLAGKPPFPGDSLGEVLRQHCLEPPPRLSDSRPDIPPHVSDALIRAMSKKPEKRFDNVSDFVVALGGRRPGTVGVGQRPEVLETTAPVSTWRFGRRSRVRPGHLPLVAAFGGLLFAVSVALASLGAPPAQGSMAQAAPEPGVADSLSGPFAFQTDSEAGDTTAVENATDSVGPPSVQPLSKPVQEPSASPAAARRTARRSRPTPQATPSRSVSQPRVQIAQVVQRLARAIESRSVDRLAQVHVNLTREDRASWAGFFRSVQTLEVRLTADRIDVEGNSASASLSGRYEYRTNDGSQGQHSPKMRVTFEKRSTGWFLTSIKNQ